MRRHRWGHDYRGMPPHHQRAMHAAPLRPVRPVRRPGRSWPAARQRFDALRSEYARYECDPLLVLRLPALADVRVPSTARFVEAFAEAQALDTDAEPAETARRIVRRGRRPGRPGLAGGPGRRRAHPAVRAVRRGAGRGRPGGQAADDGQGHRQRRRAADRLRQGPQPSWPDWTARACPLPRPAQAAPGRARRRGAAAGLEPVRRRACPASRGVTLAMPGRPARVVRLPRTCSGRVCRVRLEVRRASAGARRAGTELGRAGTSATPSATLADTVVGTAATHVGTVPHRSRLAVCCGSTNYGRADAHL